MYLSGELFYPAPVTLRVVRPHFLFGRANANPVLYRTAVAARICDPSSAGAATAEALQRALRCRNIASRDRSCARHFPSAYLRLALRVLSRQKVKAFPDFSPAHARSLAAPQTVRLLIFQTRFQSRRCRILARPLRNRPAKFHKLPIARTARLHPQVFEFGPAPSANFQGDPPG